LQTSDGKRQDKDGSNNHQRLLGGVEREEATDKDRNTDRYAKKQTETHNQIEMLLKDSKPRYTFMVEGVAGAVLVLFSSNHAENG
jgi:hypothetical protein